MRITRIEVEQFGAWSRFDFSLDGGLTVFYGPNEAGKTTLLRFIRGVLYGFSPSGDRRLAWARRPEVRSGSLVVEHQQQTFHLRRVARPDDPNGVLTANDALSGEAAEGLVAELLGGVDEKLFESVFAIGLPELQELAVLHDDEVAEHIYNMSLGPVGRRLLEIDQQVERRRARLVDPQGGGRLLESLDRTDALEAELGARHGDLERYQQLCRRRDDLERTIEERKKRQRGIQTELEGHSFLRRAWTPWRRVNDLRGELASLADAAHFPADGLTRLDLIDEELETATKCRDALLAEARQLRQQAESRPADHELRRHVPAVQALLAQRPWIEELQQQVDQADAESRTLEEELDWRLAELGGDWSRARLDEVDTSPLGYSLLAKEASRYRAALGRRKRLRRRYDRLNENCRQRELALKERLRELGFHGESVDEPSTFTRKQLANIVELGKVELELAQLREQQPGVDQESDAAYDEPLPRWVFVVLACFAIAGGGLAIAGLATGITTSVIVGAIYTLLGVTAVGLAWGIKAHLARHAASGQDWLGARRRDHERALAERQSRREQLASGESQPPSSAAQAAARLEQLEQQQREYGRIQRLRRRLSEWRSRFRRVHRDVSAARQSWCAMLTRLGYDETLKISAAFEAWQTAVELAHLRQRILTAESGLAQQRRTIEQFRRRVEELGRRMHCWNEDYQDPSGVLAEWENELRSLAAERRERRQQAREAGRRRREAAGYRERLDDLRLQRSALLLEAGASDRESFEDRALKHERRAELAQRLAEAERELEQAAQTQRELAVVEDDLARFDPQANAACIETLELELEALQHDIEQSHEESGRVQREIEALEQDTQASRLRFELAQLRSRRRRAAEEWFAVELAAAALEELRTGFEREHQPATLSQAGPLLERLTCGKYRRIWTPLGRRQLCIDDDAGQTLPVELLSGGTREQLFLALRLAIAQGFAHEGRQLPLVLDDVTVNFDQQRAEAAVNTLISLAGQGQQVLLFTSHLFLAHLFEGRGVNPVWLPAHQPRGAVEDRRAG